MMDDLNTGDGGVFEAEHLMLSEGLMPSPKSVARTLLAEKIKQVVAKQAERVSVTIHSAEGVLMAVMFEGAETVSLALDDERLATVNRALGQAGACVDFVAREGGAA